MSIFYFAKGRFPKPERRVALRAMFDREGTISDKALEDDDYFTDFRLSLSGTASKRESANYKAWTTAAWVNTRLASILAQSETW